MGMAVQTAILKFIQDKAAQAMGMAEQTAILESF